MMTAFLSIIMVQIEQLDLCRRSIPHVHLGYLCCHICSLLDKYHYLVIELYFTCKLICYADMRIINSNVHMLSLPF